MKFYITSFQFDPEYIYTHSYKVDSSISQMISKELSNIKVGFNLIFSISCYADNPENLVLKNQIRGRKKPKEITQFLSFPHKYLEYRSDWVLNLSKFDFVEKENAYRTYPLRRYISLIIESLQMFCIQEELTIEIDFNKIESKLINHFENNKVEFVYQNEELMTLQKLIDGTHPCFFEDYGDWLESDIGENWLKLKDKYQIDDNGNLKLK